MPTKQPLNRPNGPVYSASEKVKQKMNCLLNRKAPGEDHISNSTLKHLPKKAAIYLTNIING